MSDRERLATLLRENASLHVFPDLADRLAAGLLAAGVTLPPEPPGLFTDEAARKFWHTVGLNPEISVIGSWRALTPDQQRSVRCCLTSTAEEWAKAKLGPALGRELSTPWDGFRMDADSHKPFTVRDALAALGIGGSMPDSPTPPALDLAAIAARDAAATPGPWIIGSRMCDIDEIRTILAVVDGDTVEVAMEPTTVACYPSGVVVDTDGLAANLDFIAHARTDVPALLAEVALLRKALDNARPLIQLGLRALSACREGRDYDGGDIQEGAKALGVVEKVLLPTEGERYCGEGCPCEEFDADYCYRDTAATVATRAALTRRDG